MSYSGFQWDLYTTNDSKVKLLDSVLLCLPYPPSVNHYWKLHWQKKRKFISDSGKLYRKQVVGCVHDQIGYMKPFEGRIKAILEISTPDNRQRDIDNLFKAIFDSLAYAGVYKNDCQIDEIVARRAGVMRGGQVIISLDEIGR